MKAEDVSWHNNPLVLGKLSGRNAFSNHMEALRISFKDWAELDQAFLRFKNLADKKNVIYD